MAKEGLPRFYTAKHMRAALRLCPSAASGSRSPRRYAADEHRIRTRRYDVSKKNDGRCVSHKPSADSDFPAAATDDSRRWLTTADDSRCCDITPLPRSGLPSARDGEKIRVRVGQRHGQRFNPHAVDLRKQGVPVADRELGEGAYAASGVFRIRLGAAPRPRRSGGVGADDDASAAVKKRFAAASRRAVRSA